MVDTVAGLFDEIRKEKQYVLDIDTMDRYFLAYGLDKNSLSFNLLFPPYIDPHYVQ